MELIIRLWANVWYMHVCFYFICFVILVVILLLNLLSQELLFISFYKISFLFLINHIVTLNLHHYVLYEWLPFSMYTDFLDLLLPHVHLYDHVVYESYMSRVKTFFHNNVIMWHIKTLLCAWLTVTKIGSCKRL